jgi:UPF0716 protein FxsA
MKLIGKIFLLFTISTFVEMYLLLQLTKMTNIWVTISVTLISGFIGAYLAKREGLRALSQLASAARLEQEPTEAVLDSVLLLVGAALLFAPGMITDLVGLMLLLPVVRKPLIRYLKRRVWQAINRQMQKGTVQFFSGPAQNMRPFQKERGEVIDIEVER